MLDLFCKRPSQASLRILFHNISPLGNQVQPGVFSKNLPPLPSRCGFCAAEGKWTKFIHRTYSFPECKTYFCKSLRWIRRKFQLLEVIKIFDCLLLFFSSQLDDIAFRDARENSGPIEEISMRLKQLKRFLQFFCRAFQSVQDQYYRKNGSKNPAFLAIHAIAH